MAYQLTKDKTELANYLKKQGWLAPSETIVSVEKPGEGNMNFTLRVDTGSRSFIVKQSRDYVEKYPQVAAPVTRALREAEFYEVTAGYTDLNTLMPKLLGVDAQNNVLQLEDLGDGQDYTCLYKKDQNISKEDLKDLINYLAQLHTQVHRDNTEKELANREMRKLNHEHIFIYPFVNDNGLNLDDILLGLEAIAQPFKNDSLLKEKITALGNRYLEDGSVLLHGDYFPGSWLKTKGGIKIIDPEFCFFGTPEFELGVTLAHLKLAEQSQELIDYAIKKYTSQADLDMELCQKFTAVEILRRILGLAQLPLELDLAVRHKLLQEAQKVILN